MEDPRGILEIAGKRIPPGKRMKIEIPIARLFDDTEMSMPVMVIRGRESGPVLFLSAAIHGDEINGVETIKRLLANKRINSKIKGTLIAMPIVNAYGFNSNSRYLPDRRDLNRCFPGSETGSLGGQIAHILMREIIEKSTHGIDLHTGAIHRSNLPQIRADLTDPETETLAKAFGVPVIIDSNTRDGSLRQAALEKGIPMLLFEGGEALRYEEKVIQTALMGILSVMESIGMIAPKERKRRKRPENVYIARTSYWVRAPHSGSLRVRVKLGAMVKEGQTLGVISDPYGSYMAKVKSHRTGIIIGMTMLPLLNQGDAMFHIAIFEDSEAVEERLEDFDDALDLNDGR
ncbi:succinylglutamate desuccinylase/aspartoacylase family protein [Paremcibacter congregatus]|uniref:succinylglutamate desuccinylase/aspartoacylase family protein n=1 Tax=Paremcibacter congregatus TaxID=2043170 RepID=UPI0030EE501B|tara:strand:+ start:8411 stop:9448 length:1038 start_codon:yes stop_codon:yes gene_type:complete